MFLKEKATIREEVAFTFQIYFDAALTSFQAFRLHPLEGLLAYLP